MRSAVLTGSLVTLFLTLASSAFAAAPIQDKTIRELRSRFQHARIATVQDLRMGESWNCTYHSGIWGDRQVDTSDDYYKFETTDRPDIIQNTFFPLIPFFKITDRACFGPAYYNGEIFSYAYIRVEPNGNLIIEMTNPKCENVACLQLALWPFVVQSISNAQKGLLGYRECRLEPYF